MEVTEKGSATAVRRLWPILAIIAAVALLVVLGPDNATIFAALRDNRQAVVGFVEAHAAVAGVVYVVVYALSTALSIPGGTMLTVIGGFLFGPLLATAYVVVGATVGATTLFVVARSAIGDRLRARAGPWLGRMEAGFRRNAFTYLLILRLVPLFPFFVVNLVPAFLGVGLGVYVVATLIGIVPGAFVYALAGAGLGQALAAGERFELSTILTPEIVAALIGLAVLAALPALYRRLRRRAGPP